MGRRNQSTNGARETRPAHSNDEFSFAQGSHTRQDTGINDQRKRSGHKRQKRKYTGHEGHQQPGYSAHRRSECVYDGRSQFGPSTSHPLKSVVSVVEESPAASEPTAMEIPGFYFDPVKKKYFKITANHVFGSHHPYSQQSIKERTKVKPDITPIKKRSVQRFPSMASHYGRLGWFLQDYQLGLAGNPRRQLCEVHAMLAKSWRKHECSEPLPSYHEGRYTHMTFDHTKQELYLASSTGGLCQYHIDTDPVGIGSRLTLDTGETSATTSLHLTQENLLVTTYLGNGGQPGTLKMYMRCGDWSRNFTYPVMSLSLEKSNIWSCDIDSDKIAIGGDRRVVLLREWETGRNSKRSLWTGSDVFSVHIDPPERRNIVYAGCRNGDIRIFDLNQPTPHTGSEEDTRKRMNSIHRGIGHKLSPAICMKRLSGHNLITAAMNGEILMWDTRFVGGYSSSSSTAKPVLDIREPLHNYFAKASFDINTDETLMAAGNGDKMLSLWSLSTGDRIQDLDVSGSVGCLNFTENSQSIWTAVENQLQLWEMGSNVT
ncbi:DDB1 and CUL4 associated factor 4-like 2 [Mortierella sp. NVP85]|nr:DDB1 and CUL4 associated factor 4-like 2 [Mortierella sp. NVP85]